MAGAGGRGGTRWRPAASVVAALAAVLLWLAPALPALAASARLDGLPLLQRFGQGQLPGAPSYSAAGVDSEGTLYVGSSDGVMVYRSGDWELVALPRRTGVYSLLVAPGDRVFVAGVGVFGRLHQLPDGRFRFEDLIGRLGAIPPGVRGHAFYDLVEAAGDVYVRNDATLFRIGPDGSLWRTPLPDGLGSRLFSAGGRLYGMLAGAGLCRLVDGRFELVRGGEALADVGVAGVWPHRDGLLVASGQGFHRVDAGGVHRLGVPADALLQRHRPYSGTRLRDGSLALSADDGSLLHVSADLAHGRIYPVGRDVAFDFTTDPEGWLWVVTEAELVRLRLPAPWTVYDQRHGLERRLFDFAYFDGALWVASTGVLRARPAADGGVPVFEPLPWPRYRYEVLALLATPEGLLIGNRRGLALLAPGMRSPRWLLGPDPGIAIRLLEPSPFDPDRVLAVGGGSAMWLVRRDGAWRVQAQWRTPVGGHNGLVQLARDEAWLGDPLGGVHRWRFEADSGRLLEQEHLGSEAGLETDPELGTRLLLLDDTVFAISGTRVQRLRAGRFVPARLPELPGLERPWELAAARNAAGTFVWTSQRIWWCPPGEHAFRLLRTGGGRVPGYRKVELQEDGRLRVLARAQVLQFDPAFDAGPAWRPRSRIDRIQLRHADGSLELLPRQPAAPLPVPPGAAVGLRLGLSAMESEFEFRYRIPGYQARWSEWSGDRDLLLQHLPPGDHTLEYQGRVRGGVEAGPERLAFRFQPFWYERWPVRLLFLLAVLAAAAALVRLRVHRVNERNRELERRIAERTAELEQANRKLAELAVIDGLTGVPNRRALERALARGWQRCAVHREPLALVMVDVDHFKRYNDGLGHQAGDALLRRVAAILTAAVHGVDEMAARYGGEEFVLVLPGVGLDEAVARAEAVRGEVERSAAGGGPACTLSMGVAVAWPPAGDVAGLLGAADGALYRAKREGRNRVCVASGGAA